MELMIVYSYITTSIISERLTLDYSGYLNNGLLEFVLLQQVYVK
jgi:hypothetical protein